MPRALAAIVIALLLGPVAGGPAAPPSANNDLESGIALVKEGDFEAAVLKLDAAIRAMEADPALAKDLPRAYVYLGAAYLELEQETTARAKFREALRRDPAMTLDSRQFSPQTLRVFEAARGELGPAPRATPMPRSSPKAAGAAGVEKKKGGGKTLLIVGGGVAAAGVAAAALAGGGGGGSQAPPTTPIAGTTSTTPGVTSTTAPTTTAPGDPGPTTTTAPPGPTTTTAPPGPTTTTLPGPSPTPTAPPPSPTPTPPPTTMPRCTYGMSDPGGNPYSSGAHLGVTCGVQANCAWNVDVQGGEGFILNPSPTSGSTNGEVRFDILANFGTSSRTASISIRQDPSASCRIEQRGTLGILSAGEVVWSSELFVEGAQGQVVVDGASRVYQGPGAVQGSGVSPPGTHRLEALLVSTRGRPGSWRFTLAGGFEPGTLRVIAGNVESISANTVVFRLAGKPGERLVLAFQTK